MNIKEYKKVKNYFTKNKLKNTKNNHEYIAELLNKMVETDIIGDIEFINKVENGEYYTNYYNIYKGLDEVEYGESQVYDELAITWEK